MTSLAFNDNQLSQVKVTFDRTLLQRSDNDNGRFTFNLPKRVLFRKIFVENVVLPSRLTVHSKNNIIKFQPQGVGLGEGNADKGTTLTATLISGVYTIAEMLTEIQFQMNAAAVVDAISSGVPNAGRTYTVIEATTNSVKNGLINIEQNTGNFIIDIRNSTFKHILGLKETILPPVGSATSFDRTTAANDFTTDFKNKFEGTSIGHILSPTIGIPDSYAGIRQGCLCSIPLPKPKDEGNYHPSTLRYLDLGGPRFLNHCEFQFINEFGTPMNFQGQVPIITAHFIQDDRIRN